VAVAHPAAAAGNEHRLLAGKLLLDSRQCVAHALVDLFLSGLFLCRLDLVALLRRPGVVLNPRSLLPQQLTPLRQRQTDLSQFTGKIAAHLQRLANQIISYLWIEGLHLASRYRSPKRRPDQAMRRVLALSLLQ